MRKKHLFWMVQIIMVLLLSATMAYAQIVTQAPITPQIDASGMLIDENEDTVNPSDVCIDCVPKGAGYRIFYSNCTPYSSQSGSGYTGVYSAFDRDASWDFTPNATKSALWPAGRSHIGYCQAAPENYLFAICNCVLKTQFLPGAAYVFEVEVMGDGVYWTNRNLSLLGDAGTVYDNADFFDGHLATNVDSIGEDDFLVKYPLDNVIRYIIGTSQNFFCTNNAWLTAINTVGWLYPASVGANYSWDLGYVGVQDYINRVYNPNFDLSTCTPNRTPFALADPAENDGDIGCPLNLTRFTSVNAKVLRTYPTQLFSDDYPVLSQTPYLYLDLPTMIYRSDITELCDEVYVMITIAQPFTGICSTCCNLPMCSCKQFVGVFGCDESACEEPIPGEGYTKCIPYITNMLNDGWWDFLVVANMSESSITPLVTFYANGQTAEYQMAAIGAKSSSAVGLVGDISDYIGANYPSFPRTGASIYAEVTVEGTTFFDAFYLTYNSDQGTTGYLARCAPCGVCTTCD